MTLYDSLGLDSSASLDEVKRAYRSRAKQAHPDAGGTAEEFAELSRAYLVLSDPERRARYDATGDEDRAPENAPLAFLVQIVVTLATQAPDPLAVDLVAQARQQLERGILDCENAAVVGRRNASNWKKVAARFKTGKKSALLKRALEDLGARAEQEVRLAESQVALRREAFALLQECSYAFDDPIAGNPTFVAALDLLRRR